MREIAVASNASASGANSARRPERSHERLLLLLEVAVQRLYLTALNFRVALLLQLRCTKFKPGSAPGRIRFR
jgi:hypothetical protein